MFSTLSEVYVLMGYFCPASPFLQMFCEFIIVQRYGTNQ